MTTELINVVRPTKYVDIEGRAIVHNEQIITENPEIMPNEFLGHAVMTLERPFADPASTDKLIWKPDQVETTFAIRVRRAVGKSVAEFHGRLLDAFRAFDAALKAHQELTQAEVRKEVERLETEAAKINAAEAAAAPKIIIPGGAAEPGTLIVPGAALPERHIERGQE